LSRGFGAVPVAKVLDVKEMLGVVFSFGGQPMEPWMHVLVILGTAVLFFSLVVVIVSRTKNFT